MILKYMVVKRQIKYNIRTETGEQTRCRHRWTFLIINESREIERIRGRIYKHLKPVEDMREIDDFGIKGTNGLHCNLFSFSTDKSDVVNPEKIYDSDNFRRDRDLREDDVGKLDKYLSRILNN